MAIDQGDRNRKITILSIVWKDEIRQNIEQYLADESMFVLLGQTDSGINGIELCKNSMPDVVLVDRSIQDIDNLEIVRQLKEFLPSIGVVMLSDLTELQWMQKALVLGVSDFVRKHLDKKLLLHAIKHAYETAKV